MATIPIAPIGGLGRLAGVAPGESKIGGTTEFKDLLGNYMKEVNAVQENADKAVRDLATGKTDNIHQIVVAINEADLSFQLMMQMRNKLIDAYHEVMRMQM